MTRCVGRPVATVMSSAEERLFLECRVCRRRVARGMSDRRRIVLRCADGSTSKAVAAELGVYEHTVGKWRRHFLKGRIEGLSDAPRSGRPQSMENARARPARAHRRDIVTFPVDPQASSWNYTPTGRDAPPAPNAERTHAVTSDRDPDRNADRTPAQPRGCAGRPETKRNPSLQSSRRTLSSA